MSGDRSDVRNDENASIRSSLVNVIPDEHGHMSATTISSDLDALLDSALEDFDRLDLLKKTPVNLHANQPDKIVPPSTRNLPAGADSALDGLPDGMRGFLQDALHDLQEEEPALSDQLRRLITAAASLGNDDASASDFKQQLDSILGELGEDGLNNINMTAGDVNNNLVAFPSMRNSTTATTAEVASVFPAVQSVFSSVLSKDLTYPPMKKMQSSYVVWLRQNSSSDVDRAKYEAVKTQSKLVDKICALYENDDAGMKMSEERRINELVKLIDELQRAGPPPQDLLDTVASKFRSMDLD